MELPPYRGFTRELVHLPLYQGRTMVGWRAYDGENEYGDSRFGVNDGDREWADKQSRKTIDAVLGHR